MLLCQRLTDSPHRIYVTGQRVSVTDFSKSDEGHRRYRLGSSPMSIRLAAASAALSAEEASHNSKRPISLPRRASAADATATKFREIFPVQQKSLRSSFEKAFSSKAPFGTDSAARENVNNPHTSNERVEMLEEGNGVEKAYQKEEDDFTTRFSNAVGTLMRKPSNFSLKSRIIQLMRDSSNQGRPDSGGNINDLEDGLSGSSGYENQQDPLMRLAAQGLTSSLHSSSTHPNRVSPSTKRSSGGSSQPGQQVKSPPGSSAEDINNQLHDEKLSRNLLKFSSLTERRSRKANQTKFNQRPILDRKNAGALDVTVSPPKSTASTRTSMEDQSFSRHQRIWSGSTAQHTEDTVWTSLTDDESIYKQGLQSRYRQRGRVLLNGPIATRAYEVESIVNPSQYSISNDTAQTKSDHASFSNLSAMALQNEESGDTHPHSPPMPQRSFASAKPFMPIGYRSTTLSPMLEVSERPGSVLQQLPSTSSISNQLSVMRKGAQELSKHKLRSGSFSNSSQELQATTDTFGHYGIVLSEPAYGITSHQNTNDSPLVVTSDSSVAQVKSGRDRGLSNPNSISSVMLIGQVTATPNLSKSDAETSSNKIQTISSNSAAGREVQKSKSSSGKKIPSSEADSSPSGTPSVYYSPGSSLALAVVQSAGPMPLPNEGPKQEDSFKALHPLSRPSNTNLTTKATPFASIDRLHDIDNEEDIENLRSTDSPFAAEDKPEDMARAINRNNQAGDRDTDEQNDKAENSSGKIDKTDNTEQFLREAKLGDSINLSDDVDIDQQPDWVLADERRKEREKKLDQALKAGIEMADEDVLSIFLDKRGFSHTQADELNAHRNDRRRKRVSKEAYSMRSAPTQMERILSGQSASTYHDDDELSSESESSDSQFHHDYLSYPRTSSALAKLDQDQKSEASFGLHDIADNARLREKSFRAPTPSSKTKTSSSKKRRQKQKQKENANGPDDLPIRAAEAVVQAAPHRSSVHLPQGVKMQKSASEDILYKASKENVSPFEMPSAFASPHVAKLHSPFEQVDRPILEHKTSFGQSTVGAISLDSNSSRGTGPKRQIYLRQSSGSHSTFGSDKRNQSHSNSSNSGSAVVSEHAESSSGKSPMTGIGERGGIDVVKKHVLPKIVNPRTSPVVTPQSALIAMAGPPSRPPDIPLPPPPPEEEMKPKDASPISGNSVGALSSTSLNKQRILTRVEENSDDSRPSTPEMAVKAKAILAKKRNELERSESSATIWNSAKEDDSIAESSAYESDEKRPGSNKVRKSKQKAT